MQYTVQMQEHCFFCGQHQPKVFSMQIHVYGSAASIYLNIHHYKLWLEFLLTKKLEFQKREENSTCSGMASWWLLHNKAFSSSPLNIIYWNFSSRCNKLAAIHFIMKKASCKSKFWIGNQNLFEYKGLFARLIFQYWTPYWYQYHHRKFYAVILSSYVITCLCLIAYSTCSYY